MRKQITIGRRRFVPRDELLTLFRGSPRVDFKRFRKDIDAFIDQQQGPGRQAAKARCR